MDTLIGRLVERLREKGIYERSLIVLTSDHGMSFRAGDKARTITKTNYQEVISIPLIIKAPNQKSGVISDRNVETVDIVPTIADILGVELPWKVDGVSALTKAETERKMKSVRDNLWKPKGIDEHHLFDASVKGKFEFVDKKVRLFKDGIYNVGPFAELIDRPATGDLIRGVSRVRTKLSFGMLETDVVSGDGKFPLGYIRGRAIGKKKNGTVLPLAVSVNGTVRAVTETRKWHRGKADFSFLIPESAFRSGENRVEIFVVTEAGGPKLMRSSKALETDTHYSIKDIEGTRALVYTDENSMRWVPIKDGELYGDVYNAKKAESGQLYVKAWLEGKLIGDLLPMVLVFLDEELVLEMDNFSREESGVEERYWFDFPLSKRFTRGFEGGSMLRFLLMFDDGAAYEFTYSGGA